MLKQKDRANDDSKKSYRALGTSDVMSNKMWGGRFTERPDAIMEEINVSIDVDRHLYAQDIAASKAHAAMLAAQGIITANDAKNIQKGLDTILSEIGKGSFDFKRALEDIHMNVESRLGELIGPAAGKLHTARSRNDQVATDLRLYVRDEIDSIDALLAQLQLALAEKALAHAEMFGRDRERFADSRTRLNESPLGAAALAGTGFAIDRDATAKALGFARASANSLDAVSDRDFALESLAAASIAAIHLSRLAEEIVMWTSPQFGFARLSDRYTTGSSIMPQKRNPDAAELVRAKTGRIAGAFFALLMVMKGLPLAYAKDMQEDKEPVFDALASLSLGLAAMAGMVGDLEPDARAMKKAAGRGHATATDLADWLVREAGLPSREAHHVTGRIVALADTKGCDLAKLTLEDLKSVDKRLTEDAFSVLDVSKSVKSRRSYGGTAPGNVRREAKKWIKRLKKAPRSR